MFLARLNYLGHLVGDVKVSVPVERVEAFASYGKPTTKKGLRLFIGAIGNYRKFIRNFTDMSALLIPATSLEAPRRVEWSREMERAFSSLCKSLCQLVTLYVPRPTDVFILYIDASGVGVGGCLHTVHERRRDTSGVFLPSA